jgi:hypothetical protein
VRQAAEEAKAGSASSTGDSSDTSDSEEHKRAADGTLVAVEHRATGAIFAASLPACCLRSHQASALASFLVPVTGKFVTGMNTAGLDSQYHRAPERSESL